MNSNIRKIIDCKEIRARLTDGLIETVNKMKYSPLLTIIQVGNHPASNTYVSNKIKYSEQVGIKSRLILLPEDITKEDLIIAICNHAAESNGLMVQLPLPKHLQPHEQEILDSIPYNVDVDGLSTMSLGKLMQGKHLFTPCTVQGVLDVLNEYNFDLEGKKCLVIGRSLIVGKPLSLELTRHNATVTLAHSKTDGLEEMLSSGEYDLVVSAIGSAKKWKYINASFIIDVGINRTEDGKLCGDINLDECIFDYATTVGRYKDTLYGGVGQLTVYNLILNTIKSYQNSLKEN